MRPALDQSTQQRRQASPTVGKHVRPVRRMSSRAAQSSGKRSASVRNGLRKQPAIRPPLAQRHSTRCMTRRTAALIQAHDASPTMRDGRAIFGRRSCGVRAASARNDASHGAAARAVDSRFLVFPICNFKIRYNYGNSYDQIRETLAMIPLLGIRIRPPARQRKNKKQFTPIRSTTRSETPSSGCTRSADEISMNRFSSSNWTETNFRRRSAAAAAARGRRLRRRLIREREAAFLLRV
ncbi:hypothetical protein F511_25291 [Dorcoceras hygrometricum]|uniref:Uncharacterized protein n=1 Tax=Dorcoceras hygrometricum TaxID=472368 RepID=A0A2Z7BTH0_9LAMI|nr:hypothetical protein F511_25291 [Dorcoceras hygrometricum]